MTISPISFVPLHHQNDGGVKREFTLKMDVYHLEAAKLLGKTSQDFEFWTYGQ
jgi:hypothetical protein